MITASVAFIDSIIAHSTNIDFATFDATPKVYNSYLTSLQSTTSTSGTNINALQDGTNPGNLKITLPRDMAVLAMISLPISTSTGNAYVNLSIDGTSVKDICTTSETTSHITTGYFLTNTLTAGEHTFTFKIKAASGATAYVGAYRTISIVLSPIMS